MNKKLFERVALYRATMAMLKKMLDRGLISEKEHTDLDRMFAEKYGLKNSVIYR